MCGLMRRVHHVDHVTVIYVTSFGLLKRYLSDYDRRSLPKDNVKVDWRICSPKQSSPL